MCSWTMSHCQFNLWKIFALLSMQRKWRIMLQYRMIDMECQDIISLRFFKKWSFILLSITVGDHLHACWETFLHFSSLIHFQWHLSFFLYLINWKDFCFLIPDLLATTTIHFWGMMTTCFYTGLSPHQPCVSSVFVFSSDQVCSQGSLVIGSMVGTYFSHEFGVYSCIFGVYLRLQWFPKLYTNVPILWNIDTAW